MISRVLIYLLLTVVLFHVTAAVDCKSYISISGVYKAYISCDYGKTCCGTCYYRFCCSDFFDTLSEDEQDACAISFSTSTSSQSIIGLIALGISIFAIVLTLICCCCPCCCLYNVCRKPSPVVGTSTTTVVNTQCVMQQPPVQGAQYPPYQPVPTQPPYGGQPYQAQPYAQGPYQAQPYAQGPPPPYQTVAGPGYPSSQAAYPPTQAGFAPMPQPTDTSKQPPYNPAFMQPPPT